MGRMAVKHNYREQNRVVDLLAKEGGRKFFFGRITMLAVPPVFANEAVWADILGIALPITILECNSDMME